MTPTAITATKDNQGSVLTYHFDHAITGKGMGISLPELPQPGAITCAVLENTGDAWLCVFAIVGLSLTLSGTRHAVLLTVLFSSATAFGYGLLAGFSDLLFGFWGTAVLILLSLFALLAILLMRVAPRSGKWIASQFLLFAIVYPCIAGLDNDRQSLYLNLCALEFLSFTAWLLVKYLSEKAPSTEVVAMNPAV
jgi:hypothetical protein